MESKSFAGKVTTSLWWWLGKRRPFILDDQFKIELLFIDTYNMSAKIRVTNLKTGEVVESATQSSEVINGQE
jgi:hypothetical protein